MPTLLANTLQDLRFALRQLRRAPAFAVTAVLTLALGIGANTAVFSLLDQALLRSLPVQDPASLVILEDTATAWEGSNSSWGGDPQAYFSYPMYRDLRDQDKAFSGLIATSSAAASFARPGAPSEIANTELVSGNYFTTLGVAPAVGQLFTQSQDEQPGADPVVVLSFAFWRDHLGADPALIGRTVALNGQPFQILGVAAPNFRSAVWGQTPALFVPMAMQDQIDPSRAGRLTDHKYKWLNILGRLKPGESRAAAEAASAPLWHALRAEEMKALGHKSQRFTDGFFTNSHLRVLPGARGFSYSRDTFQGPLVAVMAMAVLVLLIAAVNVASLLLVRSAGRVREFSLRFALGAAQPRVLAQLLLEGLLIGIAGGLAGILLAPLAIRSLVAQLTSDDGTVPFASAIDTRLLLFNFAIAILISVLFSLAPALQLRKPNLATVLRQSTGTASGSLLSLRRVIVGVQIALSVLLLVGAGLFVRTLARLHQVEVGFNPTHLVTFGVSPKLAGYTNARSSALTQSILDTLSALPGVLSVGATNDPELAGNGQGGNIKLTGYTPGPEEDTSVEEATISPAYFHTMQIPLLTGRAFTDADNTTTHSVVIVNQAFARHFCNGDAQSCLGRHLSYGGSSHRELDTEIVGVTHDARHTDLRTPSDPSLFTPLRQEFHRDTPFLYFYLRTAASPAESLPTIRRAMHQIDPALALVSLRTMDEQIDQSLSNDHLVMLLAVAFGLLATLLAGVGIYGVLAFTTAQRTREIGIRIALGSSRLAITRLVLLDVLTLAGIGIAVALPVAFGLARLLRSQLFGVSPADPLTLTLAVLTIAGTALVAALIPARRAAAVDPTTALRTE